MPNCFLCQVVRNKIGYSIEEVTSASTSTCPESKPVREAVKEFQVFLSNFEVGFYLCYMI